ncbi:MAG: PVC-type heme-binding CxxCH protein, partial [Aureliella sp.]
SGRDSENMRLVVVDLRQHAGGEAFLRIVDNARGGWGHINFDDFRLHAQQPGPISTVDNPLVADQYPFQGQAAGPAAAAMKLPAGFRVIPAAAEPDVKQPIAMALDDRGRVWIAEAYEYPVRAKGNKGRDRILVFEDTDGDGTLDKRKVFAEGLNLVSGLEVGFGGVWVGAAPYLLFLADEDGDDVADGEPKILLDGWGYQDTHETLNTFIWGPDGWLYGCHGVFTHSKVGKPGASDDQRQPINAGIWRYHPTRHEFEVFAHGTSNPWGVDFNDRGQAFLTSCVIPHLYHIIQGGRYERQAGSHFNPYTYNDIKTAADHRHYLGARPHSGNGKSDAAGGGHAHAGAMIYLGGAWPAEYRDKIFMNNIHGQRLNMDILKPSGSGYVGSHGPDFLLTGDQASQILNLRYGPDGQCMMIDWYDMQACHLVDASRHDRSNGRIYKIVYGANQSVKVDLAKYSDQQLAELVTHENDWYVRHSRRLLQERAAKGTVAAAAVDQLRKVALEHPEDTRRLRGAWALACIGQLDLATRDRLLADASPYVRGWAIQLSLDRQAASPGLASPELVQKLTALAKQDPSPVVRLYLASAAARLPLSDRWDLLAGLASHASDAGDANLPLMIWYAAEPLAEADPQRALALGLQAGKHIPLIRDYMLRRIGSGADGQAVATLVGGLEQADSLELQLAFLDAIRTSLTGQRRVDPPKQWSGIAKKLSASSDSRVRLQAQALGVTFGDEAALASVREMVATPSTAIEQRREALASLLAAKDAKLVGLLQKLLDEPAMREQSLAGLAQYNDPRTAELIIDRYAELTPAEKRTALATLAARSESAIAMLQAVASRRIANSDLSADLVRQLQYLKNDTVAKLLEKTWGTVRETAADKIRLIHDYKQLVAASTKPKPDLGLGRAVFARTCQQCHSLFGTGGNVGPDLTGSNRSNLDYLLSNIVDPSAVMAKEYQPTVVLTSDGRVVTGILKEEDDKAIKLQTATALEVIPKDEIDDRKLSPQSMMPDDQLKQFSPKEVVALLAYLGAPAQVPILADEKNAATLFNGKDLSGWHGTDGLWSVENGELVGRTSGLKKNEFLVSDLAAANFKLVFEVKLVDNAGNSGVQFRSQSMEHGVKGYQADIGAGWWGKLYEEEGRGLLWKESGEEYVKLGDWNTYEIVADGRRIQTRINGHLCVDLDDAPGPRLGIFALQLHSGGATEVRFRNFQLTLPR